MLRAPRRVLILRSLALSGMNELARALWNEVPLARRGIILNRNILGDSEVFSSAGLKENNRRSKTGNLSFGILDGAKRLYSFHSPAAGGTG